MRARVVVLLNSALADLALRPIEHVLYVGDPSPDAVREAAQYVRATGILTVVCHDVGTFAELRASFQSQPTSCPLQIRRTSGAGLWIDAEATDGYLAGHPLCSVDDLARFQTRTAVCRALSPLIASGSVMLAIVKGPFVFTRREERLEFIGEIFRALAKGGRVLYTDVATDEDVGAGTEAEAALVSAGFGGALREGELLAAFESVGFYGLTIDSWDATALRSFGTVEVRGVAVSAWRGKEGPCFDQRHAVVYRGPFKQVEDDDGHVLRRGERMAVCEKTFHILSGMPYRSHLELVEPRELVALDEATPFPCHLVAPRREPAETKRTSES